MSRLTILIPFVGNTELLEDTLVSVLENRPSRCEVLVVLGRPYEDPYDVGDEVRFVRARKPTALAGCLNLGLRMSRTGLVHVVACGTEVAEGWTDDAMGHFKDARVACVAPLVLNAQRPERVVAAGVDYHAAGTVRWLRAGSRVDAVAAGATEVLSPHMAAAFYRKSALERVGGFEAGAGDRFTMLDVAIALQRSGHRTILEPGCQVRLSPAAHRSTGTFRKALDAERFFWRWAGANGWSRSVASHVTALAAEAGHRMWRPSIVPWIAGRLLGGLSIGNRRRSDQRFEQTFSANQVRGTARPPHYAVGGSHSRSEARRTVS